MNHSKNIITKWDGIITDCDSTKGLTKFIPYNEVSISYVLLLFIIGVKKIVLYIEDFVQLKFHCKCLSFTVRYPPRLLKGRTSNFTHLSLSQWETPCSTHIPTKSCAPSFPVLYFLLLWCQLAKTNIEGAENIIVVATNVTSIVEKRLPLKQECLL